MNNRLTYEEYKGNRDILNISLHNGYSVIAIKIWNKEKENYTVEFRLRNENVDKWDIIDEAKSIEFDVNYKIINSAILKQVSDFWSNGLLNHYIDRYEYELRCFDIGNSYIEKERLDKNAV